MIEVIHIRDADFTDPSTVYIGRPGKGYPGSPLANPFRLEREEDRDRVLKAYRRWLWEHLQEGSAELAELRRLMTIHAETGSLKLVCFCAPKACHGDYIKSAIVSGIYEPVWRKTDEFNNHNS